MSVFGELPIIQQGAHVNIPSLLIILQGMGSLGHDPVFVVIDVYPKGIGSACNQAAFPVLAFVNCKLHNLFQAFHPFQVLWLDLHDAIVMRHVRKLICGETVKRGD